MGVTVKGGTELIEVAENRYELKAGTKSVEVITVGIQGPPGPPGPSSPGQTYTFNQGTPAATWTIAHNLGQYPSVTVVDSGGTVVGGDVEYIDLNNLVVSFNLPFGGKAYLN